MEKKSNNNSCQTIICWVDSESWRQLRENLVVAYVKVVFQEPKRSGFTKIEINSSSTTKTEEEK